MERNFYNEEFEQLIRQKADQHKMYPSDKVWKDIHRSLHTRRRWFIAGMSLLITGLLFYAAEEFLISDHNMVSHKKVAQTAFVGKTANTAPITIPAFSVYTTEQNKSKISNSSAISLNDPIPVEITSLTESETVVSTDNAATQNTVTHNFPVADLSAGKLMISNDAFLNSLQETTIPGSVNQLDTHSSLGIQAENVNVTESIAANDKNQINWLQENASYRLAPVKQHRFNLQFYLSPTMNYRVLSGGDNFTPVKSEVQNVPLALTHYGNVNDFVNHKPALGFEVGSNILYKVTRNLTLKTGLQFNYSSYTIKAYTAPSPDIATIALNSSGYATNSITAYTSISNFGGDSRENLSNQYFQLSLPVGVEFRILGNEKLQLNVAGSIQPTYLLNRSSYLLTSDYKNYAKEPSLVRQWNFNGSVEAFVSYKTGSIRWQIGPQFRYQLLSTYTDQYPIKEYLREYGIKIGISKTIR